MKQRVYIAGAVSGLPEHEVIEKFNKADQLLVELGYLPVNPVKIVPEPSKNMTPEESKEFWVKAMNICLPELMGCEAIFLLPDWRQSKGARIEEFTAREMGLHFIEQVKEWEAPKLFTYKNPK